MHQIIMWSYIHSSRDAKTISAFIGLRILLFPSSSPLGLCETTPDACAAGTTVAGQPLPHPAGRLMRLLLRERSRKSDLHLLLGRAGCLGLEAPAVPGQGQHLVEYPLTATSCRPAQQDSRIFFGRCVMSCVVVTKLFPGISLTSVCIRIRSRDLGCLRMAALYKLTQSNICWKIWLQLFWRCFTENVELGARALKYRCTMKNALLCSKLR